MGLVRGWHGGEAAEGVGHASRANRAVRRRGAALGPEDVCRFNDLFYVLLVDEVGLSPADAGRVLSQQVRRLARNRRVRPLRAACAERGLYSILFDQIAAARSSLEPGG